MYTRMYVVLNIGIFFIGIVNRNFRHTRLQDNWDLENYFKQ